ncbi:MAG: phosphoenolpyruvate--protein phosphotransferase [Alphaproteobacteria bacterium]|nr:phosphoenolpyruvate--protein phosphotransferase [Alphaproteobacteria bacterium]MCY4318580.1 phosphoenolpyruvate--protein phosphotransferase [Alphaproteobacteria bacterium]
MTQPIRPDASRLLLRRVREVAATVVDRQDRLDGITAEIADAMGAEVCSIYIRHGQNRLLLTATMGLNAEAVHNTTLTVGEGLVGLVAERAQPVNLPEAAAHENFAHRPETGEEAFHSFVGVPLLRGGLVVGVLTVQNVRPRLYARDEVDALQTVAMLVAEVAASHEPPGDNNIGEDLRPVRLEGRVLNAGVTLGTAYMHEVRLPVQSMVSGGDAAAEIGRVDRALEEMHRALDDRFHAADLAGEGEHREVLQAYRMFAEDRGWLSRIHEAVRSGLSAEGAVARIQEQMRARMRQMHDPFFRERLHDLDDLSHRLLEHLVGEAGGMRKEALPADAVLITRHMGPAELLDYPREKLRALLLEEGSHTAHVVIVARALDIPVLGDLKDLPAIVESGDRVAVDGENGQVFIRPGIEVEQNFRHAMHAREERRAQFAVLRDKAARSADGVEVSLSINAGLLIDIRQVTAVGADGVGLYRTEIPFMVRSRFPDVEDQQRLYRRALDLAEGRPLVFRTLDIGGDKVLPYWRLAEEENPAMGWRALRLMLDRPQMLRQQLRAMVRAAGGRDLHVMFPMVAEVSEFARARTILYAEIDRERRRGRGGPAAVHAGAMLEVPALVWQMPALLRLTDFISVGSNDLLQFFFAADRTNPKMATRYDLLSPAVLAFFAHIVDSAEGANQPLTFCGEMAGGVLEAMALVGLGFRKLSVAPASVGPVKAMLRATEVAPLADYVRSLATLPDHTVRDKLRAYALDHEIPL